MTARDVFNRAVGTLESAIGLAADTGRGAIRLQRAGAPVDQVEAAVDRHSEAVQTLRRVARQLDEIEAAMRAEQRPREVAHLN